MIPNFLKALAFLAAIAMTLFSCDAGGKKTAKPDPYAMGIDELRKAKDQAFKTSSSSPLPAGEKGPFVGLDYYPVRPEYRIIAEFLPLQGGTIIEIPMNNGASERYYKTGYATFDLSGERFSLLILRSAGSPNELFLPFYDLTNGSETYGGGRYLQPRLISDNKILIDFNQAYNPYCVYAEDYACPLPPPENRLSMRVEAGEKVWKHSEKSDR